MDVRSWIDALPDGVKRSVEARMRTRVVADTESIHTSGDDAVECYRIRSGAVRVSDYTSFGREFQLAIWRAGDCFGEIGLIDGLPHTDNAYAAGRTQLEVLDKTSFDQLRIEHPAIDRSLNAHLCSGLRRLTRRLSEASLLPLKERLPRLLGDLLGRESQAAIGGVSQNDLANMLGVTRQSVSHELKALEREGWIVLGYRSVSIRNLPGFLERFGSGVDRDTSGPAGRAR